MVTATCLEFTTSVAVAARHMNRRCGNSGRRSHHAYTRGLAASTAETAVVLCRRTLKGPARDRTSIAQQFSVATPASLRSRIAMANSLSDASSFARNRHSESQPPSATPSCHRHHAPHQQEHYQNALVKHLAQSLHPAAHKHSTCVKHGGRALSHRAAQSSCSFPSSHGSSRATPSPPSIRHLFNRSRPRRLDEQSNRCTQSLRPC